MTTALEIVRAAIPDVKEWQAEHILWGRTPYPVGRVTPRDLYRAASRLRRAKEHGLVLCDHCDNVVVVPGHYCCAACTTALERAANKSDAGR